MAELRAAEVLALRSGINFDTMEERLHFLVESNAETWLFDHGKGLGDGGTSHIARMVEGATRVKALFLIDNGITDAGVAALARALETNTSVTSVFLGDNLISDAGVAALASMLSNNNTIEILSLSNNQIGDQGAAAFARVLGGELELHDDKRKAQAMDNASGSALGGSPRSGGVQKAKPPKMNKCLKELFLNGEQHSFLLHARVCETTLHE